MESAASTGVKISYYLYDVEASKWLYSDASKKAGGSPYVNASTAKVMRLENNDTVEETLNGEPASP